MALKASFGGCPPEGTAEYAQWQKKVINGKRRAKRRRRAAGLWSVIEVAVLHELPLRFVRRLVAEGGLPTIKAGRRQYVRAEDAERVLGKPRGRRVA